MKLTNYQVEFLVEKFFYEADEAGARNIARKLLTDGQCIIAGTRSLWYGGVGNYIKSESAPGAVGCVLLRFDLENFLISDYVQSTIRHTKNDLLDKVEPMQARLYDVCQLILEPACGTSDCTDPSQENENHEVPATPPDGDTQTINVPVVFNGVVSVKIPKILKITHAHTLAQNLAVSRVLATTENPDAPDSSAFEEFVEETSISEEEAAKFWCGSELSGVEGTWTFGPKHNNPK